MGTDKRNRQKENRRVRLTELAHETQRQKIRRRVIRITVVIAVVVGVVGLVYVTGNNDEVATSDSTVPIDTTVDSSTAPVVAGPFTYGSGECAPVDGSGEQVREFSDAPRLCIDPAKSYTAVVTTNKGEFTIELFADKAPGTVNNFVNLARFKYFDNTVCHRAIPSFAVQCGDPTATGSGDPGYSFADELPAVGEYKVGSIAMANSGANTNGSQFFIITGEQGVALPPNYTLFGQVTDGLQTTVPALDKAGNDDPASNGVPPKEELRVTKVLVTES